MQGWDLASNGMVPKKRSEDFEELDRGYGKPSLLLLFFFPLKRRKKKGDDVVVVVVVVDGIANCLPGAVPVVCVKDELSIAQSERRLMASSGRVDEGGHLRKVENRWWGDWVIQKIMIAPDCL